MKRFLLFSLYFFNNLYGSEVTPTGSEKTPMPSPTQSSIRHLTPVSGDKLGGSPMTSFTPSSSVSAMTLEEKYNCCAKCCAYSCCACCSNNYPTSFWGLGGQRANFFTKCCDFKNCCTEAGCCEVDKDFQQSCSASPCGLIVALFTIPYRIASNCFHDCVTSSPDENRGDCFAGPSCLRYGPPACCICCKD